MSFPEIGGWYRRLNGDLFEVVAVDEKDATIELQYFDGTVEEMDMEAWGEIYVETIDPPEDWSGSVDMDYIDLRETQGKKGQVWNDPLEYLDATE